MISQELLDQIIYVSLKKQYITKELIEIVVLDVIDNCDKLTKNLFGGIYFGEASFDFFIAEADENNRIIANYEEMIRQAELSKYQSYIERNLKIIAYLLHEIEHLKEERKLQKNTFESNIIRLSNLEYVFNQIYKSVSKKISNYKVAEIISLKKYEYFYKKNWCFMPIERIAEVEARRVILKSLKNYEGFSDNFFDEYKNLTGYYISALKMGYEVRDYSKYNSPLFRFYKSLECIDDLKNILNIVPKLTSEQKMMYGLPIKPIDIVEVNKMKIKCRR